MEATSRLDLYWIPLGAGARVVRASGHVYEALVAGIQRRPRQAIYHAALVAIEGPRATSIEVAPIPDRDGRATRGVVAEGPVGLGVAGLLRVFRYEVRCWPGGTIPDLRWAVDSPVVVTEDRATVRRVLDVLPDVPTPVWGRDHLRAGEMWNSNSVVSWALVRAGVLEGAGAPPRDGRAPGWDAGVVVANRCHTDEVPEVGGTPA